MAPKANTGSFAKLAVVGSGLFIATLATSECSAQLMRDGVTVQGVIRVGEFLGPPAYGEDPRKDLVESSYYLQLPAPILAQQQSTLPSAGDLGELLQRNGHFVQLVVYGKDQVRAKQFVGCRVEIAGRLIEAHTGHHRTPLLLELQTIRPITQWRW
jgi:Domain of unknown function (DUF4431)